MVFLVDIWRRQILYLLLLYYIFIITLTILDAQVLDTHEHVYYTSTVLKYLYSFVHITLIGHVLVNVLIPIIHIIYECILGTSKQLFNIY